VGYNHLAMIAEVEFKTARQSAAAVEGLHFHSRLPKFLEVGIGKIGRTDLVVDKMDPDPACSRREETGFQIPSELVIADDVKLQEHIGSGTVDAFENRGENLLTVNEEIDR